MSNIFSGLWLSFKTCEHQIPIYQIKQVITEAVQWMSDQTPDVVVPDQTQLSSPVYFEMYGI